MSTLQCTACGTSIPTSASFCGLCGKPIDIDQVARKQLWTEQESSTVFTSDLSTREDDWNWQQIEEGLTMRFPPENALLPFLGANIGLSAANVPVVQGSPQIGGVPSLQGTPQGPGSAMTQAPWQQPPAGTSGPSAAPNAPSSSAPMQPSKVSSPHYQHHERSHHHPQEPQHHSSHHPHHSGHPHDSGSLHSASQTRHKRHSRMHTKGVKYVGRWHLKSILLSMVGIIVIGGLAALFLLPLLHGHAQPPAALIMNGSVVPGGNVSIQGRNFTPGGTITFTIDGHQATSAVSSSTAQLQSLPGASGLAEVSQLAQQATNAQARGTAITVKSDGSFETTIQVDPAWLVGSSHMLDATEQSSGQHARIMLVIPRPAKLVSCASSTVTTSIVLGPVSEGQAQPASTGFALCTSGSGNVQWTASWNKQQVKWLSVDSSGSIQAPLSKQLTISASALGLKAGSYNAIVTFTDSSGLAKVTLNVTFIVRSAQATACLNTSAQSLTYTATQGLTSPGSQMVTLTNCGASGSWSATTHTDDGANWLHINPASGHLNSKASVTIPVSVSSSTLGQGIYTGQVTFKTGSGIAVVNVILNVQPSPQNPLCISVVPQSLTFSATQGQGNPASQTASVGNCGPAASWSATSHTDDGANWLGVNPASGSLASNASQNVSISVSSANLQAGTYTGQVMFKMGASSQTVSVAFTILQPQQKPCLSVNTQSLPFTATQGQGDPDTQTLTLTNCGPAGSWSASTANGSSWLKFSPTGNTLSAGGTQSVAVSPSTAGLSAGNYNDTITFTMKSDSGTTSQTVSVSLTVQAPPPPPTCISASTGSLTFNGTQGGSDPAAQTVTLNNCGPAGTWATSTANGSSWLGISPTGNTLNAGASQNVTARASIAGLSAGTYNDTITFTIKSSTGTNQVTVAIALTVQQLSPPCIQVNPGALTFTAVQRQGDPAPQSVTLTSCGSSGSWSASTANGSGWLTINPNSNTLNAGATQNVTISPSIANLSAGTYTDTLTFTITNSGGTNQQSVAVTLTVQSPPPPPCLQITSITPAPNSSDGIVYVYPSTSIPVVITNCGSDAGTVAAGATVGWLSNDLSSNTTLNAGGSLTITFTPSSSAPYNTVGTGTITLTTGGGSTPVSVNVSVLTPIQ